MESKKYLGDLVKKYHRRSGLSYSQIEKRTGVPAKTITSWARGLSKRPRRWQDLAAFSAGLQLTLIETNELLRVSGHPPVATLLQNSIHIDDQKLLSNWNLPHQIFQVAREEINFVRRTQAQAMAEAALDSKEPLCIIQGMGGIGKSTLASKIATKLRYQYRDGVLWGDLRLMSNNEILDSWANLIGFQFPKSATTEAKAISMWGVLSRMSFLIVLDDASSLINIKQLLPPHQTKCGLLITTRDKAIANGVTTNQDNIISLGPMCPHTSIDLFESILGESFVFNHINTLEKIADKLGHLPLALNIYAHRQRISLDSPDSTLLRLQNTPKILCLLKFGDKLIQNTFEQSWEMLDEQTKLGFKQISHFEGREFSISEFKETSKLDSVDSKDILSQLKRFFLIIQKDNYGHRFQQHTLLAAWGKELMLSDKITANTKDSLASDKPVEQFIELKKHYEATQETIALLKKEIDDLTKNIQKKSSPIASDSNKEPPKDPPPIHINTPNGDFMKFTERQMEVIRALCEDNGLFSNKELADSLFISPGTLRNHMREIYKKSGCHKKSELVVMFKEKLGKINTPVSHKKSDRAIIMQLFTIIELRIIAYDMEIDAEQFPTKGAKAEFVLPFLVHLSQIGRYDEFIQYCKQKRPNESWKS